MPWLGKFRWVVVAVLLAVPARAGADGIAEIESAAGVGIQASLEGDGRLAIAILPRDEVRLNGRLGVAFEAATAHAAWRDALPRLVLGDGDYIDAAVFETLRFRPRALTVPAVLAVRFGSCLPITGICVPETAEVTLTAGADGRTELRVDTRAP